MKKGLPFDLNEVPMDEDIFVVEGQIEKENVDEPFVGQCFLSEEEALVFYQKYAKLSGFSVRKGRFENKKGENKGERKRRDFFCHREGKPGDKLVDYSKKQRNRVATRCECTAIMRVKLRRMNDIFPEEWQVTRFVSKHNHDLLSTNEVRFLPSYRSITIDDEKRILLLKEGGLSVRQIMRVMELEKNVKHGELNFLTKDVYNFLSKYHKIHSQNDAKDILEYCKNAKIENHNFQYDFTTDTENRLEHIFWSHAQCYNWCQKYGDVVVFDTTYKVNSYDMPFGIFVGIDNHGRTILLGCALLRNETIKTFQWLFKVFTWLIKKSPKTILTDQDPWMTQAIAKEMPFTKHAFCIWHITSKFSGWFTSILKGEYSNWCSEFYNLYRLDTVEEFEHQWPLVTGKYKLDENKHVVGLYKIKEFWVPAYLRGFFFGGMTTTGRSESINAFIKRFISSRTCLSEFIKQVDLAIENVEQKQMHDTMLVKYRGSCLRSLSPLEEQGRQFFTPYAFKKFQEEFGKSIQYSVKEEKQDLFEVKHHKASRLHKVIWDGKVAKCSCKNFEFVGILCRHILSVLVHKDCFEIPSIYWSSRWCRQEVELDDISISHQQKSSTVATSLDNVALPSIDLVDRPPKSTTKGRPKKNRLKPKKELAKQVKRATKTKKSSESGSGTTQKRATNTKKSSESGSAIARERATKTKKAIESEDLNPIFCLKC